MAAVSTSTSHFTPRDRILAYCSCALTALINTDRARNRAISTPAMSNRIAPTACVKYGSKETGSGVLVAYEASNAETPITSPSRTQPQNEIRGTQSGGE